MTRRPKVDYRWWIVWSMAMAIYCAQFESPTFADPPNSPGELVEIAELHDLLFLDADQGWSVGDQGVIWQTHNGGRTWRLVDSPATCRLESIHFADLQHGWIVGGWIHPLTHKSTGVVLHTQDGGRKWVRLETSTLPALKWVWFADRRRGWAAGNSSAMYPGGFVYTEDGGRTWNEMPVSEPLSVTAAAVGEHQQLLAISRTVSPVAIFGNQAELAITPNLGLRKIHAIDWKNSRGWLVGDQGTILTSNDGGRNWRPPAGKLPEDLGSEFDWHTVAAYGSQCWIAGSPGTVVLHSADHGMTWQLQKTRHRLPLRCLQFLDEQHGWAAGAFGCILATRDGGRTWRVQRQGSERAGVVGTFSTLEQVPWELYANVAAENGHSTVVEIVNVNEEPERETSTTQRAQAAAVAVGAGGCNVAWRFPVPSAGKDAPLDQLTTNWATRQQQSAIQALEEHIVRLIRIWQPDILVCDTISSDGSRPLAHLVSQVTLRAAQQAGDPALFVDQIAVAGLDPWSPKKVFTVLPPGQHSGFVLELERLIVPLGCSLADYSAFSRGLISTHRQLAPPTMALRLIHGNAVHENAGRELFGGIMPGAVGESRRSAVPSIGVTIETLGRALDEKRLIQLLSAHAGAPDVPAAIAPQLDQAARSRTPHQAGILLQRIAQRFAEQDKFDLSLAVEAGFVDRFPDHVFAEASVRELVRKSGSAEWQRALAMHRSAKSGNFAIRLPPPDASDQQAGPLDTQTSRSLQPASFIQPAEKPAIDRQRVIQLQEASKWASVLQMRHAATYHEPETLFRVASIQRRLGDQQESLRIFRRLSGEALSLFWKRRLRGEELLLGETNDQTIATIVCRAVEQKPYLDGKLDEPLWTTAATAELRAADVHDSISTEVRWCFDERYLYFAVRCAKDAQAQYNATFQGRSRDANLVSNDRIEISLDLDRDYSTAFRLAVDYRGWTSESCDDYQGWNPTWHVAASSTETQWLIEAAMPLDELESVQAGPREPWAISVRRTLPGGQNHFWPQVSDCGYLVFQ